MKRLAIAVIGLAVVIVGALAIAPALVPTDTIRDRLVEQISAWLGRPVTATGDPVISLYPRPTVRIEGVTIGNADGNPEPFMTVEVLTGTARLFPLLLGRVELREFELIRPVVALHVDPQTGPNWRFDGTVGQRVAEALDPAAPDSTDPPEVALGRFVIQDGTVTYQVGDGKPAEISDVQLDISWPSTARAATARGSLVWRGQRIDLSASLDRPLDLIAHNSSPGSFRLSGSPLRIDFEGTVGRTALDFAFEGDTSVAIANLRRVLAWAGAEVVDAPTLGPASIDGHASWSWPMLSFASSSMMLDGNVADGAFTVDFSGARPSIRGTIAADDLDLSVYAEAFQTDVQADGAWTGAAIDLPVIALIDSDVRLSAGTATINSAIIDGVAASAVVEDGRLVLSIGDAELYGGRLRASVTGRLHAPSLSVAGTATITGMDVLPAFTDLLGVTSVTGRASGTLDVAGEGTNWGELVEHLSGTLTATILNGSLAGVDVAAATALPSPTAADLLSSAQPTGFDRFGADFRFADGSLVADRFEATGPGFALGFLGEASLMRPSITGRGIVRLAGPSADERLIPFQLSGTWFEPELTDDPDPMSNLLLSTVEGFPGP